MKKSRQASANLGTSRAGLLEGTCELTVGGRVRNPPAPSHAGRINLGYQRALSSPERGPSAPRHEEPFLTPAHCGMPPEVPATPPPSSEASLRAGSSNRGPAQQNLLGQEHTCLTPVLRAPRSRCLPQSHPTLGLLPPPPTAQAPSCPGAGRAWFGGRVEPAGGSQQR